MCHMNYMFLYFLFDKKSIADFYINSISTYVLIMTSTGNNYIISYADFYSV